ncbi:metallophosphoesterase family protein [Elizabethkingia meningoseptica]|uniref:metallophosphoesterase family protein n=1 Tax=Elizabethkingia meningoseptica TaxID=238 RepID=UPI002DD69F4A|nr:metallophosphoesterase family protein [Elizabethkingia meningoseptica]MEC4712261.1 metallophosphoesterase family protein [Elizabethkingia meningoseptica]
MRVVILSDVHGNLPSLEGVLKHEKSADLIISLGDVVNYGPWSNECVDLLDTLENKVLIKGNHEEAFISGNYIGENIVAKTFFEHCYPVFDRRDRIINYIEEFSLYNSNFRHTLNNIYVFPDTEIEIDRNTFIGHSHRIFSKMINNYRLVNVGSVGQNRLNLDEINYVVWDTDKDSVELIKKSHSADKLIKEMQIKKYPDICIEYLQSKRISSL